MSCVIAVLTLAASAAVASPPAARTASPPSRAQSRAAVIQELRLTGTQEGDIRAVIQSDRRDGLPTTATRRRVLRILSPAQCERLNQLFPVR